jgi:N-methylhydantoinase A
MQEYERTLTTVANSYVRPAVESYVRNMQSELIDRMQEVQLHMLRSDGGRTSAEAAQRYPVKLLMSGPAGGVAGAIWGAEQAGFENLLTFDMGGTSTDVCLVQGGRAQLRRETTVGDFTIRASSVDVRTVGAGGGSVAHVPELTRALRVGPESAGADPGPVCYGRGGSRPTVTDANLVLGLLSEEAEFAGGSFQLTRKGVDEAFEKFVAGPMGCSVEEAAFDSWRVVNANMTQAVQRLTAEKGTDPRDLVMLAYGGNGPMFAAIQAQDLNIDRVLVPKASPTFSALGALAALPSIDEERSYLTPAHTADLDRLRELWGALDERAEHYLVAAGFQRDAITARYQLSLRYPGQNWALAVDVVENHGPRDLSFVDDALPERMIERFHQRHLDEYGHSRTAEEPEITGVRLVAWADIPKPTFGSGFSATPRDVSPTRTRRANLGAGYQETGVYWGPDLRPGDRIRSPAIVEETFTTIVVYPSWEARVDDADDYLLIRGGDPS